MKNLTIAFALLIVFAFVALPALAAPISPHSQAVMDGTLLHKGAKDYAIKVDSAKTSDGKAISELKGMEIAIPADKAADCEKMVGKKVRMVCDIDKDGKCTKCSSITERKIKMYKSTMKDETSPTPKKDSMGMDMVPVYEGDEKAEPAKKAK